MTAPGARLRVALVAPSRYPVREPYAGGLESLVATLAAALRADGHEVELYAVRGSQDVSSRFSFPGITWGPHDKATDTGYPPGGRESEQAAFDELLEHLVADGDHDVIHNHSLHPGLLLRAHELRAPLLTTLHTPPLRRMRRALTGSGAAGRYHGELTAVSTVIAGVWGLPVPVEVIGNGIDLDVWPAGPGGESLVWTGRLVPEKAPHLALEAAREAGRPLRLAGRVGDADYVRERVWPLLSSEHEYLGELSRPELATLVGSSACALVTPVWQEPFGLVVAEALACGTPVAAFRRGGVAETLGPWARLCSTPGQDPVDLARVVERVVGLDRSEISTEARGRLGAQAMYRRYLDRYLSMTAVGARG